MQASSNQYTFSIEMNLDCLVLSFVLFFCSSPLFVYLFSAFALRHLSPSSPPSRPPSRPPSVPFFFLSCRAEKTCMQGAKTAAARVHLRSAEEAHEGQGGADERAAAGG